MVPIERDAVLRALKKFKRLAKQDLLASGLTDDPAYWEVQAQARRETYDKLMEQIENEGVEAAARRAQDAYAALPLLTAGDDPRIAGQAQAYELFFTVIGLERQATEAIRARRTAPHQDEMRVGASP